jgi:Repeat of unknown function (DUF5648)/Clostridium epsilon toxin ETX/Bacillus mosquitocidal toxin MTX2
VAGDHFYTRNVFERDEAANKDGYHVEGIAFYICPNQEAGSTALTRLFNAKVDDHFYTTSVDEANNAAAHDGYKMEGTAGYVFSSQVANTFPLYRLYNGSDHFYTASAGERDTAIANDKYHLEGIAGYVYLTDQAGITQPFWRLWNEPHPLTQATSVVINSITYDTDNAVIQQTNPINLYDDTVTNDTAVAQASTISGSQSVTDTSGWSDSLTVSLQASAKLKLGIPLVINSEVQVTVGLQTAFTWNGSESRQTTWNWSQPVSVPPKSSVHVSVVVSQSALMVPYTTNSTFAFADGSSITCETFGTYSGLNSHDMQVHIA